MSFGFGVGDFLTTIDLAKRIRSRFVDAPAQFAAISADVKSLSNVLRDIEDVLPARELTTQQTTELKEIAQGARDVLRELGDLLDKYQDLGPSASSSVEPSVSARAKRAWKKLNFDPKEINFFRARIISSTTPLNVFLGKLNSRIALANKEAVDGLHTRQDVRDDNKERRIILEWLDPDDYHSAQQSDYIGRRQPGTGQWLLDSSQFQTWIGRKGETLFCPGIPGAGKTILSSVVVDHLHTRFEHDNGVGIACLYCNFRRQDKQTPLQLLTSLLKQITQAQNILPQVVKDIYQKHKVRGTPPSTQEISDTLKAVVGLRTRCFIVIDALDECDNSNGHRKHFLTEILSISSSTNVNVFATSRYIPEIEREFEMFTALPIRASDEDIERYLGCEWTRLSSFVSRNAELQKLIRSEILKASDGIFPQRQKSPKAIRIALADLPKGSDALDVTYKEAMERIQGQVTDSTILATQVLSWIAFAKRPLSTLELQHAIAVEADQPDLDPENVTEVEDLLSVCAGLVTVDEESNIVRLIHYTTQTYFERTKQFWFPNAETSITQTCLGYLSFEVFGSGAFSYEKEFEDLLEHYPLYSYVVLNWGSHLCAASPALQGRIPRFLLEENNILSCAGAFLRFGHPPPPTLALPSGP